MDHTQTAIAIVRGPLLRSRRQRLFRLSPARVAVSGSESRRAPENLPAVLLCGHETDPVRSIAQALATVSTGLWSTC
jgi:hypothetical protein